MNFSSLSDLIFQKLSDHSLLPGLEVNNEVFLNKDILYYSLRVAAALNFHGANNEAIGLIGQRSASSYFGILGILFSGCHYVPINLKYDAKKKAKIIKDSSIKFLVGSPEDLILFKEDLEPEYLKNINCWIAPYGSFNKKDLNWYDEEHLKNLKKLTHPPSEISSKLAYIMYTSGSTGDPKGVMVSQLNVISWLENMNILYDMNIGFRSSQTYDLSFDLSVADIFYTFFNGGTLCVLSEKEQLIPSEYIERERIEYWSSVPTLVSFMNKMGFLKPNSFPSIKKSLFCGEPLPQSLAEAWMLAAPNSTIENLYGPTEATIWLTRYEFKKELTNINFRNNNLPIGQPFNNHEIRLIDSNRNISEKLSPGEIIYKGPQITLGYLNDKNKTNLAFTKFDWDEEGDIWYKSGDIGFYNYEGDLECLGRIDSQIKIAGRRIELGELEAALRTFIILDDIVIVPLRDKEDRLESLIGFTMNIISPDDMKEIRIDSQKIIESIFFPKKIINIKEFPITPSGKTDRKKLEEIVKEIQSEDLP